jgi:hypothetical protein
MGVIEECGMLVDELRDDPGFKDALMDLHDAIARCASGGTRGRGQRFAVVAQRLVEVIERLEAQR